jgi:acetoin utilization protein AcuB
MMVSEAMNRALVAVAPDALVEEAVAVARRTGVEHLLVLDEHTLVGILCACDLRDASAGEHVSDCMSPPVITVRPDAPVEEAATTMRDCAVGCLPVQVGGLILGTLGDAELLRCGMGPPRPHRHCHSPRGHGVPS